LGHFGVTFLVEAFCLGQLLALELSRLQPQTLLDEVCGKSGGPRQNSFRDRGKQCQNGKSHRSILQEKGVRVIYIAGET
jgi:hypothetical protein